jgi:hypothetical protein
MEFDVYTELRPHLNPNESLLWAGKPQSGIVFRNSDIFMIPFSLMWGGFAIFWFVTALASGAPFFFAAFGIPFVLIGLMMIFGRFFLDSYMRKNTCYGLTDKRIIIKSGIFTKSIKSLNIKTISDIEYTEKTDGSGTINMGPKNPFQYWGNGMNWMPNTKGNPSLELIDNVRKVYNQIIELQKKD